MLINYEWIVAGLDVAPSEDGLTDVIKTVHWRLRAASEDGFTSEMYSSASLAPGDPEDFIPFSTVTKEQVVAWLENEMAGKELETLRGSLAGQIEAQRAPKIVSRPVPWG